VRSTSWLSKYLDVSQDVVRAMELDFSTTDLKTKVTKEVQFVDHIYILSVPRTGNWRHTSQLMFWRYLQKEIVLAPLTVAQDKETFNEVSKIFTPKRRNEHYHPSARNVSTTNYLSNCYLEKPANCLRDINCQVCANKDTNGSTSVKIHIKFNVEQTTW
jgi:hypothetical protein